MQIVEVDINNALSRSGLPDLDYALNPYIGCLHGCLYCYAKMYTRFRNVVDNWGYIVIIKRNLIDVLSREVKRFRKGVVGLGTITDGYQPIEAIYKLSRKSIEILVENGFRVSIQTKSSLILRDLEILKRYRDFIDIGITITSTSNSSLIKLLEPFSSPPTARIEALKRLSIEGIKTWIFYGPVIPGYNDSIEELLKIISLAKETKSMLYIDKLRIKRFMWNDKHLRQIAQMSIKYNWEKFYENILRLCRDEGIICRLGFEYSEEDKKLDKYIKK
uniref:Radical SAM protein n=2 Tax=Ignisphaera aggregans TaxID=334771 RepID=A0A7C5TF41_9CREN